ncbi:MAG: 2-dehydropantoate 2-reductase [Burkholderiales bacterium 66-5]|uniref:2-dehydropantoate 2-reductase n=1 Tax=Comamonas badia TaxID=265291 RepID=UPI00041E3D60|nr:2-dehydropantoate 2-reductase [Comamonas badia]OJU90080.1 MAG: 2-dehydropantoate 2-reductase [Burkholderiales bacterium 66-5]
MFQKIGIYGAGAIGGWIGAHLATQPNVRLSAVARGATLQALQTQGLRLRSKGLEGAEHESVHAVRASDDPAQIGPQDLVIVAVKGPALASVAAQIAPLLAPHTVVLTAMNGVPWWFLQGFGGAVAGKQLASVDADGVIARGIALPHVVGCVVHASCAVDAPGVVRHRFGNELIIGEPSGAESDRAKALVALLRAAGLQARLTPQIQKEIWYKLWGNMTMNPICALTGSSAGPVLADPLVRDFMSRVMLEAREIGGRIGIPITDSPEDRHQVTAKLGDFSPSMLQDVRAGRALELDALVSSVRELGQLTGVATPFTDALLGLARLHARQLGLYPK